MQKVPGVFVELQENAGAPPIVGVGTSTAGFTGVLVANSGVAATLPTDPRFATSYDSFAATYKDFLTSARSQVFNEAIRGFFRNGGTKCWVMPVSDPKPPSAAGGADPLKDAIKKLVAIDEIAILAAPLPSDVDADDAKSKARRIAIRNELLGQCEAAGDRFAVLDGEETVTGEPTAPQAYPNADPSSPTRIGLTSLYGAVYFPWIVLDNDQKQPPSGHVAGVFARVDAQRGVFKAPANEFIRGASRPAVAVTPNQQEGINSKGINVIRSLGGGVKVYGARCPHDTDDPVYVSVRRYLIYLKKSIELSMGSVVFEPNTPALWQRIIRSVSDFLYNEWAAGALFGLTPKQAFFVRCDSTINVESTITQGFVITEIGVSIVRPAEFVVFRLFTEMQSPSKS